MSPVFVAHAAAALCCEHEARPAATGVPLVFLHAGVADRRMWRAQLAAFAPAHPVLAWDRRGFGGTRVARPETYAQVDDLWAVMDAVGFGRAVLVGCSQGGRIALDAALARPDRLAALALIAPAASGAPEPEAFPPALQPLVDAYEAADAAGDAAALNAIEARVWLDGALGDADRVQGESRSLFLDMNGIALAAGEVGTASEPPSAWDRLETLRLPVLLAWGTLDFPHLQARCAAMAERIPGAERCVFEGMGHLPSLEAPDGFNAMLRRWLDALADVA